MSWTICYRTYQLYIKVFIDKKHTVATQYGVQTRNGDISHDLTNTEQERSRVTDILCADELDKKLLDYADIFAKCSSLCFQCFRLKYR